MVTQLIFEKLSMAAVGFSYESPITKILR